MIASRPTLTSLFLALFLFPLFSIHHALAAKGDAPEVEGAIWIAETGGALKISTREGVKRLSLPSPGPILAVAVDAERKRVWLYSGSTLSAHGFGGAVEASLDLHLPTVTAANLVVVPRDGSVWLAAGGNLLSVSPAGQELHRLHLSGEVSEVSMDHGRNLFWVAAGGKVVSYDGVSGARLEALDSLDQATDLDVDPATGRLWVAHGSGLHRYDSDGAEVFAATVEGLTAVAADSRGDLWVAAGPELLKISASGDRTLQLRPFGDEVGIDRLLFDPAHRAIWASSGDRLAKVSAGGEVMAIQRLGEDSQFHGLALYAGAPDREPPRLTFQGGPLAQATTSDYHSIRLSYEDIGSGVDAASLEVRIRELDRKLECTAQAKGARCSLTPDLVAHAGSEPTTLIATLADYLGNVTEASTLVERRDPADEEAKQTDSLDDGETPDLDSISSRIDLSLAGQKMPSLRGLLPNQNFFTESNIDAINSSNGNLNLSIPLGQVFTVGPHISYQLRATHNSDAWDHATVACPHTNNGCQAQFGNVLVSLPQKSSNAGIGWEVHFGKLFEPTAPANMNTLDWQTWPNRDHTPLDEGKRWLYVAPDGSSHYLYQLPGRTSSTLGFPVRYSKDGSQLRMRQVNSTKVVVEHPNGVISHFEKENSHLGTLGCGGGVTGCWRIKNQRDYYGNTVEISYSEAGNSEIWKIQDTAGRVHRIYFRRDDAFRAGNDATAIALKLPNGDQLGDLKRVVDRVEIAAAQGTVAKYQFRYTIRNIPRSRPHDPIGSLDPGNSSIRVPVLDKIEVPDANDYIFTHLIGSVKAGRVETVQLPTGGKYKYFYGHWRFPTPCVWTSDPTAEFQYSRWGISQKRHLDPDDNEIARWIYNNELFPTIPQGQYSGPTCKRADYRRTKLLNPTINGRHSENWTFHAVTEGPKHPTANDPIGGWQISDNGLPYRKDVRIGSGNSDYLFLSERTFDCNPTCTRVREKYVRYAMEWRGCSTSLAGKDPGTCFQVNPVQVRERTIFTDDGDKYREIKRTQHDGAGNTRHDFTLDNFTGSVRQVEHLTAYNATGGTRPESSTTGYLNVGTPSTYLPGVSQPWILTKYTSKTRIDSGKTYRTDYQFDSHGSITCMRKRKFSTGENSKDLVTQFLLGSDDQHNAGLPTTEIVAGGENGALGSGTCNTNGTEGTNRFTFKHAYRWSSLSRTHIEGYPNRYQADIDRNTGLPSALYNKSDQQTLLFYDRLGRPTRVAPADSLGEADTFATYSYTLNGQADVQIERKVGSNLFASERLIFDHFGRLRRELQSIPISLNSSANSERETVYDGTGRVTAVSTVQQASSVDTGQKSTRFLGFDAFGRPSQILRPDNTDERLTYKGEREVQSTLAIRTSQTGTSDVTTTTVFDGLGRPVSIQNPEYVTKTFYDPNSEVIKIERRQGSFSQAREYGYDNRGLLVWEKHPEIGSSATPGTMSFQPNALGNPRQRYDGLNSLTHEYDGDGRLTKVKQGSKVWEEFDWANSNSGSNYRKGKLIEAIRHNYPGGGNFSWAISEKYEYQGKLGNLSKRTTQLQFPDLVGTDVHAQTFTQTWAYDALGNRTSQTYPTCITTPENGRRYCNDPSDSQPPSHTVSRTNNQGLPVRVSSSLGMSADYLYHWNFQTERIDYSNGSYTDFGEGTNGMRRPGSITHSKPNGTTLFATGAYQYDDAGNIWAMGVDRYVYDKASRLTRGTVRSPFNFEAYTYDAADNLRSVARNTSFPAGFNIDTNKNRMIGFSNSEPDISYDAAGNLTRVGPAGAPFFDLDYDGLNMEARFFQASPLTEELYAYAPGNYRILAFDTNAATFYWTLRDVDGKILREHQTTDGGPYQSPSDPGEIWTFEKDHVYGPNGLIATRDAGGVQRFFHQDHLGTPRAISDGFGNLAGTRNYYPYGADAFGSGVDEQTSKFTGHELNRHGVTYYMLARSYVQSWLRFASVDPARSGWNLYGYGGANPVKYVDPTGEIVETAWDVGNVALGAVSLVNNLREGNYGSAALDAGGLILDGLAVATPFIPGGASAAIKASRGLDRVDDAVDAVKTAAKGTSGGPRAGKRFTPKGKREIDADNASRHGGRNICEDCGTDVVPGKRSQRGVTPPGSERQRDHIIPRSRGGDGSPSNGQILCRDCNLRKSDKI